MYLTFQVCFLLCALSVALSLPDFLPAAWNFGVSEYLQNINFIFLSFFCAGEDYHVI